jgi:hypothetical protein
MCFHSLCVLPFCLDRLAKHKKGGQEKRNCIVVPPCLMIHKHESLQFVLSSSKRPSIVFFCLFSADLLMVRRWHRRNTHRDVSNGLREGCIAPKFRSHPTPTNIQTPPVLERSLPLMSALPSSTDVWSLYITLQNIDGSIWVTMVPLRWAMHPKETLNGRSLLDFEDKLSHPMTPSGEKM